jgi:hypothetical protein
LLLERHQLLAHDAAREIAILPDRGRQLESFDLVRGVRVAAAGYVMISPTVCLRLHGVLR